MRRARLVLAGLAAFAVLVLAGPAAGAADRISVGVDRTAISTALGHKFVFRSTVTNHGDAAARNLIAHLNVLSFRDGVYIDPEDWSSHRTRYLPAIPAGGSITLTWQLQAVNAGRIGIYVAVLPQTGAEAQPPTPGPTIRLSVARRKTLNSGGILPLALGIPALLGLMTVGLRLRRRRPV